jgi:hypothetical protein
MSEHCLVVIVLKITVIFDSVCWCVLVIGTKDGVYVLRLFMITIV